MWSVCFALSIACVVLVPLVSLVISNSEFGRKHRFNLFNSLFGGVFVSAMFMFFPVHKAVAEASFFGVVRSLFLSVFNSMQIFAIGCEFGVVAESMPLCPEWLAPGYNAWVSLLFVVAPVFTFGFVLSLFKNLSAHLKYLAVYFKDVYVLSALNEKSLVLARDIKKSFPKAAIVFTSVFNGEDGGLELLRDAAEIGAICMRQDVQSFDFDRHSAKAALSFFAISEDETENLKASLELIEKYKERVGTRLYVFSTHIECELLLNSSSKGKIKVRRINEVESLIDRVLYERGEVIFNTAKPMPDGEKKITAVVIGMGNHGTEMVKALAWFGQMDGYTLKIHAFDKDPLAGERFTAIAPELMSPKYNGVCVEGEAQYSIELHPGFDVEAWGFAEEISKLKDTTYVMIALGNDTLNINTAVNLRMYFERMGIHPKIQTIVYSSQQKRALDGIKNYKGQPYDIEFLGDAESSFTCDVILDSELEGAALARHLKWGDEEEFWSYGYNYRSSVASAIHMRARIVCGIPGADKAEAELSEQERAAIEVLEHRRWNAYMRSEGYVYSGSPDPTSRNDLGKMHNDLVDFSSLDEEEKRKDGSVGSR
ncbi:MAG: hypothetical protein IJ459_04845 [Clostridia bacterium]|nr:hypothetical protein [Clostridia bacterium]